MQAILRMELPKSCRYHCPLFATIDADYHGRGDDICVYNWHNDMPCDVEYYTETRAPFCPLEIVEEGEQP